MKLNRAVMAIFTNRLGTNKRGRLRKTGRQLTTKEMCIRDRHKDIEDDGQTVTIKEVPETPEEPKEPEKPETPQTPDTPKKTDSPKTGDSTNLYGLLALLLTSGAGLAGTYLYKRRKVKKS